MGLLVGVIAKWIMPGANPEGFLLTIVLGIAGALVGGFMGSLAGFGPITGFDLRSMILAVIGALALLYAHRVITKR
jgi:uncharacterized membrane protein YeaQ/YmgE (transglycosylase-associated protein family)